MVNKIEDWEKIFFLKYFKAGRLLDVGGGKGRISIPLSTSKHRFVLLEISQEYLREAKKRAKSVLLVKGDAKSLPFKDKVFDSILLWKDVLNLCFNDYEKAFSESIRVLKNSGRIILSCESRLSHILELLINFDFKEIANRVLNGFGKIENKNAKLFFLNELVKIFRKYRLRILYLGGDRLFSRMLEFKLLKKTVAIY